MQEHRQDLAEDLKMGRRDMMKNLPLLRTRAQYMLTQHAKVRDMAGKMLVTHASNLDEGKRVSILRQDIHKACPAEIVETKFDTHGIVMSIKVRSLCKLPTCALFPATDTTPVVPAVDFDPDNAGNAGLGTQTIQKKERRDCKIAMKYIFSCGVDAVERMIGGPRRSLSAAFLLRFGCRSFGGLHNAHAHAAFGSTATCIGTPWGA